MNHSIPSNMIIGSSVAATILVVMLVSLFGDRSTASAQVVDMDEPPTNATEELDVKVDATEPLPVNGTIIVDITEADDIDIDAIPPEGVSIIVTNTTLTVTNNPVEITEGATEAQPDTGSVDTDSPAGSSENDVENSGNDDEDAGGEGEEPASNNDTPDDEDGEEE